MKNRKTSRKYRGGADPSLNPNYCDKHPTQCQDFVSACQGGGADPSLNPNYCDKHPTQCQDFVSACQGGGDRLAYKKYKKYKQKYKDLCGEL